MALRDWLIYRGAHCLCAYYGTRAEAVEFAQNEYGIGCTVLRAE